MSFIDCLENRKSILLEGALGERLKREYHLPFDENVAMASLVYSENGRKALSELWSGYAKIAQTYNLPFLATTPTRRTNKETVKKACFDSSIIRTNVEFLREVREQQKAEMYIGGLLGCHGDAYTGEGALGVEEAQTFHKWEAELFAEAGIEFLYAALMPSVAEAAGMALAIEEFEVPYIISFTIKKDGCLVDGTRISDAIQYIDGLTSFSPVCYMTNCVHPKILREALSQPFNNNEIVHKRFAGLQANASSLSYEELDHSEDLKSVEPVELAIEMIKLREISPFKIFGGCCGTDNRHMNEIAKRL